MEQAQTVVQSRLKEVLKYGQSIWYDGLISRLELEKMIREDGIRGATTNPTIFEKALNHHDYDSDIQTLFKTHSAEGIYQTLAVRAVQQVADVLMPVFEASNGHDGFVSIEVSPLLAFDTAGTILEANELYRLVNRKNTMIKIPATTQGIPAVLAVIAGGIAVNVTLIFSLERYEAVMDAYLAGLEKRASGGDSIASVASVASFFVSRVDSAVDKILEQKMSAEKNPEKKEKLKKLMGKAGIANSKTAYEAFEKLFSSARFKKIKKLGAQTQRPLWASTGTKNLNYSDVLYVEALMGPDTVDTVPPATLDAFRDHGIAGSRLKEGLEQARSTLKELKRAGIDLDSITKDLEAAGVQSFSDSYRKLIACIEAKKK